MRSIIARAALGVAITSATFSTTLVAQQGREPAPTGAQRMADQRAQNKLHDKLPDKTTSSPATGALTSGKYVLSLTPTVIDGRAAPKTAKPSTSNVSVASAGSTLNVTSDAGAVLRGTSNGRAFNVSGKSGEGTLVLSGATANDAATGSFTMELTGGHVATGKFALGPAIESGLTAKSMKLKEYVAPKAAAASSCNWWCTFKGWVGL